MEPVSRIILAIAISVAVAAGLIRPTRDGGNRRCQVSTGSIYSTAAGARARQVGPLEAGLQHRETDRHLG
jgi:hypothetical protein